jgi:HD-like signal output (HDOD) protein
MDMALGTVPLEALQGAAKSVIDIEDERYSTNHCIAGFIIAKSWHLPNSICEAVCYHHYRHIDIHKDPVVQQLVSLLLLAEFIIHAFDPTSIRVCEDVKKWAVLYEESLSLLGFDADDLADLMEDIWSESNKRSKCFIDPT